MTIEDRSRPETDSHGYNTPQAPSSALSQVAGPGSSAGWLTVTYRLGAGDVWRIKGFYLAQHPGRLAFLIFLFAWFVGSMTLYGYLRGRLRGDPLGRAINYGGGAGVGLSTLIGLRMLATIHTARAIGALGERSMTLSAEGIDVIVPDVGATRWNWSSLPEIAATSRAIYISVNRVQIIMVPRRAFASAVAADEFLESARRWHADARAEAKAHPR